MKFRWEKGGSDVRCIRRSEVWWEGSLVMLRADGEPLVDEDEDRVLARKWVVAGEPG